MFLIIALLLTGFYYFFLIRWDKKKQETYVLEHRIEQNAIPKVEIESALLDEMESTSSTEKNSSTEKDIALEKDTVQEKQAQESPTPETSIQGHEYLAAQLLKSSTSHLPLTSLIVEQSKEEE